METPTLTGPKLAIKTTMDRGGAAALMLVLSLLFAVVAFLTDRFDPA